VFRRAISSADATLRISADGGSQARWRRDGKEIFYVAPNRMLMSVQIDTDASGVTVKDYDTALRTAASVRRVPRLRSRAGRAALSS
jgi:hypothetical protein